MEWLFAISAIKLLKDCANYQMFVKESVHQLVILTKHISHPIKSLIFDYMMNEIDWKIEFFPFLWYISIKRKTSPLCRTLVLLDGKQCNQYNAGIYSIKY